MRLEEINELNELNTIYEEAYEDATAFSQKWWVEVSDIETIITEMRIKIANMKADMIQSFNKNLERINDINSKLPWIDEEIKRLQQLKKSYMWEVERRKEWIKFCMNATDMNKVETALNKLSFRSFKSVDVADSEEILNELKDRWYCRIKVEADKTKIKEAIENWEELRWCAIVENQSLIIK